MEVIFALGSNGSGQLGLGHKEDVSVPKQVNFQSRPSSRIATIAAGGNHSLHLFESNDLYWSGDATTGACGFVHDTSASASVFRPARLIQRDGVTDELGKIALIAATWGASFIVAEDDAAKRTKIYSFGVGLRGELGLGELIVRSSYAELLPKFPPQGSEIVDLAASISHVVAVLDNGDVYGWGNCRKSQLGEPAGVLFSPRKLECIGFKATRVVCTKEAVCLFGTPESGQIQVLGSDKWNIRTGAPKVISPWKDVGAGWGAIYVLKQDGTLHGWGRNDHGQLPPANLPRIKQMAVGSEHVAALAEDGSVLAWGWGEHGNCGPHVENNDVKNRWNVIASPKFLPPEYSVTKVGAGCATSWICIGRLS